jgi:hypothetical protein
MIATLLLFLSTGLLVAALKDGHAANNGKHSTRRKTRANDAER